MSKTLSKKRRAEHAKKAKTDHEYLFQMPKAVPANRLLVHNHVRPTRQLNMRGFRAWLQAPDEARLEPCDCAWAPELGPHFRVKRAWA
jgi:hypothetical protein